MRVYQASARSSSWWLPVGGQHLVEQLEAHQQDPHAEREQQPPGQDPGEEVTAQPKSTSVADVSSGEVPTSNPSKAPRSNNR